MSTTTSPGLLPGAVLPVSVPAPARAPSVPLLDVGRGNGPLRDELVAALTRVVDSGRFVFGPECGELEQALARYCGASQAVACASGSDALLLALMALDIGPGHEVIVPSFTFFATASAVARLGARPVFVDIDPLTFNLDPQKLEQAITPATRAIIPVHLFGQCAAMEAINAIAARHVLAVIEDAAQAIGAKYQGRPAGALGLCGCISFYPTKNLGGAGDGGALVTNDDRLAEKLRLLRGHGMQPRYYHQAIGINSRLDTLQAAFLNVKLRHLPQWTDRRRENAALYHSLFLAAGLADYVELPVTGEGCHHVWNQYTIRVPYGERDALRTHLAEHKIGSEIYYPVPLHRQQCFAYLGYAEGSLPETERAAQEVLSLPIFPELTELEQRTVVACIDDFYTPRRRAATLPKATGWGRK